MRVYERDRHMINVHSFHGKKKREAKRETKSAKKILRCLHCKEIKLYVSQQRFDDHMRLIHGINEVQKRKREKTFDIGT